MSTAAPLSLACPPHHWEVTTARVDNLAYYHHECHRCGAQKDVPISATSPARSWRLSGSKARLGDA